jgi:hypothetical protein
MIDVMAIGVGARLKLEGGIVAEVVENMADGQWLQVRYLESPGRPDEVGTVELCHAQDVLRVIE